MTAGLAVANEGFPLALTALVVAAVAGALLVALVLLRPRAFARGLGRVLSWALPTRVVGLDHLPASGGALLVPNHVSALDWLYLLGISPRPIRFLLERRYARHPMLRPFIRRLGSIPVSAGDAPRDILRALRAAGAALDDGELVCIFAEGQVTRIGVTLPFKRGVERVVRGRDVPIVPVHLDRAPRRLFGRRRSLPLGPRRVPRVTISIGEPLPSRTRFHEVRNAVAELAADAWRLHERDRVPLHRAFVRHARRHPLEMAMSDPVRGPLSRIRAVAGMILLGRRLRDRWREQDRVGIFLPPSNAAAIVNLAAATAGRVAVNLNYTAGPAALASSARQAGLRTVVTSKQFLRKADLEIPEGVEPIFLEDLARDVGRAERLLALALALLAPVSRIEAMLGAPRPPRMDDVISVIFSSGSTGEPKGVELTHFNLTSNAEAVVRVFHLERSDRLLGILPLFHSFGYLMLWIGAAHEPALTFFPNPLDARAVGETVQRHRVTLVVVTPTFLQMYTRRCTPEQFASLRLVVAGAEKLPRRLATKFERRFGILPLEGYGATECSPVIAVNVRDFEDPDHRQVGHRPGTVGLPLPGVATRIRHPETEEPCGLDEPGMLWVKGPNVMRGYLGRDDLTREVLRDGWYRTGDVAVQDAHGFLEITDRLSRFSKIGGEMVPHGRVEEALQEASGREDRVFAVTGVHDGSGERLVVLHTLEEGEIPEIREKLDESRLPNLFRPKPNAFVSVDELPVLGSGKLDLVSVKKRAQEAVRSATS